MPHSYPLSLPAGQHFQDLVLRAHSAVGQSVSPFTFERQTYVHQGQCWRAEVALKPLLVPADSAAWRAFFLALNLREGTFLMGHPVETSPLGTWAGAPKVLGAHAAGVTTVAMDGFTPGATVKGGDRFQSGSGAAAHLHEVTLDGTADGGGLLTLEIWPRLRAALADDATFTTSSPKGLWRLDMDEAEFRYVIGKFYSGVRFACVEAL